MSQCFLFFKKIFFLYILLFVVLRGVPIHPVGNPNIGWEDLCLVAI